MGLMSMSDIVYVQAVTVLAFLSRQHSRTKYNAGTGKQAIEIANLCRGPLRFVSDLCLRQLGLSTNSFVYFELYLTLGSLCIFICFCCLRD